MRTILLLIVIFIFTDRLPAQTPLKPTPVPPAQQSFISHVPGDYLTIQEAIDNAHSFSIVLVAPGTYLENIRFKGKAIHLRSDLDGDPMTHDPSPTGTVIDGNQATSVVAFNHQESSKTVLEGFTITNGTGMGTFLRGGGIYIGDGSSPTITDNIITENSVNTGAGGGIYIGMDTLPLIIGNEIIDNHAGNGAGIYTRGITDMINNTIRGNQATISGGAIYITSFRYCRVIGNVIEDNHANIDGGGIFAGTTFKNRTSNGSQPTQRLSTSEPNPWTITDNQIRANTAGEEGGGIYLFDATHSILDNLIEENQSQYGGGIFIDTLMPDLIHISGNVIRDNTALGSSGGIDCGTFNPIVVNNLIYGNQAVDYAGGIFCWSVNSILTNNTFYGNVAGVGGGAFVCAGADDPLLFNNIFWNNTAPRGKELYILDPDPGACNVEISYSNVDGGQSSVYVEPGSSLDWGEGMLALDPLFLDQPNHDFHLAPASPCIDQGDNRVLEIPEMDFEGDPRIVDGDGDMDDVVDMGADEYVPPAPAGR